MGGKTHHAQVRATTRNRCSGASNLQEPTTQPPTQLVPRGDARARLAPQRLGVNPDRDRVRVAAVVVDPPVEVAARHLGVELDCPCDRTDPERLQTAFAAQGATCAAGSPEQFARFVKSEQVKWGDIVKKSGAKID